MFYTFAGILVLLMLGGLWLFNRGHDSANAKHDKESLKMDDKILETEKKVEKSYAKTIKNLYSIPANKLSGLWNRAKNR